MPGTNTRLTPLAARKQLLLVESEVNRAQLLNECAALKGQVHEWTHQAHSIVGCIASAVAVAQEAFSAICGAPAGQDDQTKPSWLSTAIEGLHFGRSLWSRLRS